jgi:Cys-tRNA(Pro)/Cys-tRNA(Cys) deacylase
MMLSPEEILIAAGVEYSAFDHPPIRTLEDIDRVLKLPPDRLLKTMAFRTPDGFVLAALPILARVAYGPLARAAGRPRSALKQAGPDDLAELGMEPGGVTVVLFDVAVPEMDSVYCGSGRADRTIEVGVPGLLRAVNPVLGELSAR